MQSPPSSVVFEVNGFALHYYGVIMFFAIISAVFVIHIVAKKYYKDVKTDVILDALPAVIFFSIVGARLYYVLMDFSYYSKHLIQIPAVWQGGMSIHGGILGGILSGLFIAHKQKFSFLKYADVFAYGLTIGQAIGRWGNYFNCEAFGKPCNLPFFKLFIPESHRPFGYENFSYFHPTFLYESLWDITVFLILFFGLRKFVQKYNFKDGTIFFSYLILYSVGRIFIEACRLDSVRNLLGLPVAQLVSAAIIVVSACLLCFLNTKQKEKGKI